jgi:hypothetical protein
MKPTGIGREIRISDEWHSWAAPRQCSYCGRGRTLWALLRQKQPGGHQRNCWYCSSECFEKATAATLLALNLAKPKHNEVRHRIPLGLLMMSRGQLSHEQIQRALRCQQEAAHGRIGEWLEKLGFSTEDEVTCALGVQWACPVFALDTQNIPPCAEMLPSRLIEAFCMLPVHYACRTRTLYIGFSADIDYSLLHEIEKILDCRTEPCLLRRSALETTLKQLGQHPRPLEIVFDRIAGEEEMARIVRGYASKLRAEDVRIASCREYFWLRLKGRRELMTLLFRKLGENRSQAQLSGSMDERHVVGRHQAKDVTTSYPTPVPRLSLPT